MNAVLRGLTAVALVYAIGCAGDTGSEPEGSIALTTSGTLTTISQGSSATMIVTLVRGGGFAEPVTVSVAGLPDGVTATVSPAQLTLTSGQAVVTINVSETVASGTYTVAVSAAAAGVAAATATHVLVVTARPTFALAISAPAVSIHQGESATSEILVNRTNFPGAVSLALVSPPSGITGTFSPATVTGQNATLTLGIAESTAPGTHTVTIAGSAPGHADVLTTMAVTVTLRPDYSLSASPASLIVNAGSSGQATVDINRINFTGTVDLELRNPPSGISGTFSASSAGASVLTVSVAGIVAPGTYGLTILGRTAGLPEKTATLNVTVAPQPDYSLSVAPASLTISSGATGQATVNIQRTNFTGVVNLSFASAPNGIVPGVDPAVTTGNSAALSITVASTVVPGNYGLTIHGTTGLPGAMDRSTTVALTVTAPPPVPPPPPPPPPPQGVGSLSATPSSFSVGAGGTVTSTVLLAGTIGPVVQFSVLTAPAGIAGTFSPTIYTSSIHATSTLTLSVAANVAPGTYSVDIQGASSTLTRSATVTVAVPAQSSFTLSVPTPGTAYQGYAHSVAVQIQRTNFSGAVQFQLEGTVPAGVTHSWFQNPTTTNTGILRLVIPSGLPLGTYSFTVRGSATGYADQTVTFPITVAQLSTFSLSAMPDRHATYKGGTVVSTINIDRINFPGDVVLSLNAPTGITATLSTTVLSGSTVSSTLTASVAPNLANTGSMSVFVSGQSDTVVRSVTVHVAVQSTPIFAIGLPQSVSIQQGSSGTVTVDPVRGLYIGPVDLSVTGAPPGMTVAFAQNPISGYTTTTATISVGAAVAVGQYVLTFTGNAPGGTPVSGQLTVYVTP